MRYAPAMDFPPDPLVIGELVHRSDSALRPLGEKPWTYATGSPTIGSGSVTLLRSASTGHIGGTNPRKPCVLATPMTMEPHSGHGNAPRTIPAKVRRTMQSLVKGVSPSTRAVRLLRPAQPVPPFDLPLSFAGEERRSDATR